MADDRVAEAEARAATNTKRHLAAIQKDARAIAQIVSRLNSKVRTKSVSYAYANSLRSRMRQVCYNAMQNYDYIVRDMHALQEVVQEEAASSHEEEEE